MPSNLIHIAIANLWTTEKWFKHFEVEMHTDTTGNNRVGAVTVTGTWSEAHNRFEQNELAAFPNAIVGTTYYFRARVVGQYGTSNWEAWISEIAGDLTAPASTYAPTANVSPGGIDISVAVTSAAPDLDRYEWFYRRNAADAAPTSTDNPNLPGNTAANFITLSGTQNARFWIRAVDTSGNKQAWTYLGAWDSQANYVFMTNTNTLDDISNGTNYVKFKATYSYNGGLLPAYIAGQLASADIGTVTALLGTGTSWAPSATGWQLAATLAIDLPQGLNSITFILGSGTGTAINSGSYAFGTGAGQGIGLAIFPSTAPASPSVNTNGVLSSGTDITVSSPPGGTVTLGLYVYVIAGLYKNLEAAIGIHTVLPVAASAIT